MTVVVDTVYLDIAGIPLSTPAWRHDRSLAGVLSTSFRGDSVLIPLADGQLSRVKRVDQLVVSLGLTVNGFVDQDGIPQTDHETALFTSLAYLYSNVAVPVTSSPWTRPAVLHLPTGDLAADVQVADWQVGNPSGNVVKVAFDLVIPAGRFVG